MTLYALAGLVSGELLSLNGRAIVHDNRHEISWVFPIVTFKIVKMKGRTPEELAARYGRPFMWLKDHPDMAGITWPLDKREFRS